MQIVGPLSYRNLAHEYADCDAAGPQSDAAYRRAYCTECHARVDTTFMPGGACPSCDTDSLTLACPECGGPWRPSHATLRTAGLLQ